ncbi:MAG: tyrosine-type recombinase/integrase [Deltaproteobacteria bacterium]|nr:tyrosine-type recombinase/integrase [Deltaproteobacteria bacterium]
MQMVWKKCMVTFHRLRHSYATSLLTGGLSIVSLMKLLGHRRIEMTLRYAKVTPSHLRNEYLKAIQILEQQSLEYPIASKQKSRSNRQEHPQILIQQAAALIRKSALLPTFSKKNLLLKLSRLSEQLSQINFSQKFSQNH